MKLNNQASGVKYAHLGRQGANPAHGFQVMIQTAAGAGLFPFLVEESLMGFIEQSSRFLKPVFLGDTLYPQLKVHELKPQRTTGVVTVAVTVHNQKNELVLTGEQKYLLRKRPSVSTA